MSERTRVSVIVPTRDRPHLLRGALQSIRDLEGDDLEFEIFVGDNGSVPGAREVSEEFGATYLYTETNGCAAARNLGLARATGEFIAFLDDDDIWMPGAVRPHIEMMRENPHLEGVLGQIVCCDEQMRPNMETWPSHSPGEGDELVMTILGGYYPQMGATVVRHSVRDAIGLFDEELIGDQDWDWQLRIARRHTFGFTPTECVWFRTRPPGTFDALRFLRLPFARRVFFRHALPEWRSWVRNPGRFVTAYRGAMWQYWIYFTEAAVERAEQGDYAAARRAIKGAFLTFPFRALLHTIAPRPMRAAFWAAMLERPPSAPQPAK